MNTTPWARYLETSERTKPRSVRLLFLRSLKVTFANFTRSLNAFSFCTKQLESSRVLCCTEMWGVMNSLLMSATMSLTWYQVSTVDFPFLKTNWAGCLNFTDCCLSTYSPLFPPTLFQKLAEGLSVDRSEDQYEPYRDSSKVITLPLFHCLGNTPRATHSWWHDVSTSRAVLHTALTISGVIPSRSGPFSFWDYLLNNLSPSANSRCHC